MSDIQSLVSLDILKESENYSREEMSSLVDFVDCLEKNLVC
jgi:hypothetical protein